MNYNKGEHIDWWQSLPVSQVYPIMKKYGVKQVTNKLIYRMWRGEFPPKPKPEQFGWQEPNSFDEGGWVFEGGEEAYNKAIEEWENSRKV